jgi:hypothetical protein
MPESGPGKPEDGPERASNPWGRRYARVAVDRDRRRDPGLLLSPTVVEQYLGYLCAKMTFSATRS